MAQQLSDLRFVSRSLEEVALEGDRDRDFAEQAHAEAGYSLLERDDMVAAAMNRGIGDAQDVGSDRLIAMDKLRKVSDLGVGVVGEGENLAGDPRHDGKFEPRSFKAFFEFGCNDFFGIRKLPSRSLV